MPRARPCPYAAIQRCYPKPRTKLCPNGKKVAAFVECHQKNDLSQGDCPVGQKKVGNICMLILKRPQGNTRNNW